MNGNLDKGIGEPVLSKFSVLAILVVSLTAALHAQPTFSVLYNFGSQANDPFQPFYSGILAQGQDGALYGSALGGRNFYGSIYRITTAGMLSILYDFTDIPLPYGGLTLGTDGNFYGTAYGGGSFGYGSVFVMAPDGSLNTLYTFTDGKDGALPISPPVEGEDGYFYGTTCPKCNNQGGYGSIYKIGSTGGFTRLYKCDDTHCNSPTAPLVQATNGTFYGVSQEGGSHGDGTVFKITSTGKLTVLYNFCSQLDCADGVGPIGPLVQASNGNFYGTTINGGANGFGEVFKITPAGKLTVLHSMNGNPDGSAPFAGLVQATDGNFYGANAYGGDPSICPSNCGTLFKITPQGVFSVLYTFNQTTGQLPYSTLYQHTNGVLYGATQEGGTGNVSPCSGGNCGVLYSLNIGAAPFVRLLSTSRSVGATVEILGQGLTSVSSVKFGGVAASYAVASDTYLTATVPTGAKTGTVTVKTASGTLKSNREFLVTPVILNFNPTSGPVGNPVTITGSGLIQTSTVMFGGVASTGVTVDSDSQVTAVVPTGAKTGTIDIITPGGTAISPSVFTVTP
jgi:uncharacterized repeat protein (TIGR03803 family)